MVDSHKKQKRNYFWWVFAVFVIGVVVVVVLNWRWIYDWGRGIGYVPTSEMATIKNKLGLTDEGEFLFRSARPVLNEAEEFNLNCRKDNDEVAVLGCYKNGNIYIYNIEEKELDGIRELTTAHELLHAVWDRMSEEEKIEYVPALTKVFEENQELLEDEINTYDISEKQEELYVRAGTEIKILPDILEKHYGRIFNNQDKIVDFYESYIKVFREMKENTERLTTEISDLKIEIDAKMAEYEAEALRLNRDVEDFNNCANTAGCFNSESEFYSMRNQLLNRLELANILNNEIDALINEYNSKVDEYNADITRSRKLENMINSSSILELDNLE